MRIYLDHNATTPELAEVFEAMRPYFCEGEGVSSVAEVAEGALEGQGFRGEGGDDGDRAFVAQGVEAGGGLVSILRTDTGWLAIHFGVRLSEMGVVPKAVRCGLPGSLRLARRVEQAGWWGSGPALVR